jgi:hypothetical protein
MVEQQRLVATTNKEAHKTPIRRHTRQLHIVCWYSSLALKLLK